MPCDARPISGGEARISSGKKGDIGVEDIVDISGITSRLAGSVLLNVMGVISVKKVKVIEGFGLSTRAGIPSECAES